MHGTELAVFQDKLISKLSDTNFDNPSAPLVTIDDDKCNEYLIKQMEKNLWVKLSSRIAPNNLALRHYCLIDALSGVPNNFKNIMKLIDALSPKSLNGRLWLEGYSYWVYSKVALELYCKVFKKFHRCRVYIPLKLIINEIDTCFQKTSYIRCGSLYPAPFGDLRDFPLQDHLQDTKVSIPNLTIYPVKKMDYESKYQKDTCYDIKKSLLGFNSHTPHYGEHIKVESGIPLGFRFYTGFNDKYISSWDEIKDMLRPDKIVSALKFLFR